MKKFVSISLLCLFFFNTVAQNKTGYQINITLKGFPKQKFYLGYYFGDKQYLRDSGLTDATGKITFKGKETLEGGVYLIATAQKSLLFDFVVTEQNFSLETDSSDILNNMKVKGSRENEVFFEYTRFTNKIGKQAMSLEQDIKAAESSKDNDKVSQLKQQLESVTKQLQDYRTKLIANNPDILLSKIFKMMTEIEVPDPPKDANGIVIDSNFQYQYYYNHYFDNYDWKDERIVRTPVFHRRFESFMTKLTPQIPDSIIKSADLLLKQAEAGKENFKYCLFWITNHYETSQYMGMDKIFVHMVDNYYAKGKAFWVDETLLFKMKDRADQLRNNLLGVKAPNLNMPDTLNVYHSLYNLTGDYTLIVFYDATCHRCKEELPKLKTLYDKLNTGLKKQNKLDVYAVSLTADPKEWLNYLREMKFKWHNVYDPNNENNFRRLYDVYSTPVIYLIDKNKKIIAKRLTIEQVEEIISDQDKRKTF